MRGAAVKEFFTSGVQSILPKSADWQDPGISRPDSLSPRQMPPGRIDHPPPPPSSSARSRGRQVLPGHHAGRVFSTGCFRALVGRWLLQPRVPASADRNAFCTITLARTPAPPPINATTVPAHLPAIPYQRRDYADLLTIAPSPGTVVAKISTMPDATRKRVQRLTKLHRRILLLAAILSLIFPLIAAIYALTRG